MTSWGRFDSTKILGTHFLTLSSELVWRTYIVAEAMPTTRRLEITDEERICSRDIIQGWQNLRATHYHYGIDEDDETFVLQIAAIGSTKVSSLSRSSDRFVHRQHRRNHRPLPSTETTLASVVELPEHTGINDHVIDMVDDKQPLYGPIYSLGPVELGTLKTYNETNLASNFIRPFMSPVLRYCSYEMRWEAYL